MSCTNPECIANYQALKSIRPWHLEGDPKDDACPNGYQRVEAMLSSKEIATVYLAESMSNFGWTWHMDVIKGKRRKIAKPVKIIAWRYFPETTQEHGNG